MITSHAARRVRTIRWIALVSAITAGVAAEPPRELKLITSSSCPSSRDVVKQLKPLLRGTQFTDDATERVRIVDEGESFTVSVKTQAKQFADARRDCAERARLAAVFVGLLLDPPELMPTAEAVQKPRASTEPKPVHEAEPPRLVFEVGPALLLAPSGASSNLPASGGISARGLFGSTLSLAAGVSAFLPTTLKFPAADARARWLPLDIGARLQHGRAWFDIAGELDLTLALLTVTGERVDAPREATRLETGARVALVFRAWFTHTLGAYASLHAFWFPDPKELRVLPDEAVGTTPAVWLGASVGVAWRAL